MYRNILIFVGIIIVLFIGGITYNLIAQQSKYPPWDESGEDTLIKPILDDEILKISQEGLCLNKYDIREHSAQHDFTISLFCIRAPNWTEAEVIVKRIGERINKELPQLIERDLDFIFYPQDTEDITKGGYYSMYHWRLGQVTPSVM